MVSESKDTDDFEEGTVSREVVRYSLSTLLREPVVLQSESSFYYIITSVTSLSAFLSSIKGKHTTSRRILLCRTKQ